MGSGVQPPLPPQPRRGRPEDALWGMLHAQNLTFGSEIVGMGSLSESEEERSSVGVKHRAVWSCIL